MVANYYLIKARRFDLGLSQRDLAMRAGVSLCTVQKCERGGSITPKSHIKILSALRLTEQ